MEHFMKASHNHLISLSDARAIVKEISRLPAEQVPLQAALGRITAEPARAATNCPTSDSSLKDGYAVRSEDVAGAAAGAPATLRLIGTVVAGSTGKTMVSQGTAIRIMTGGTLPIGADAVLASEFAEERETFVQARADAQTGRNVLRRGADITAGDLIIGAGVRLGAGHLGLLAAAGNTTVRVHRQPSIMVVATGSELVAPGEPIGPGQVAASNMITLEAELKALGLPVDTTLLHDNLDGLEEVFRAVLQDYDILLTCGGVLDGDKDLTLQAMQRCRVRQLFHRVRIGPGKGISMALAGDTLIFNLPGGPPSNHVAFRQLALPGIRRRLGYHNPFPGRITAPVSETISGPDGWTQFIYGAAGCSQANAPLVVRPLSSRPRLQAIAEANCLIELPEQLCKVHAGEQATVWLFNETL
jgi:molybdopterin molybdotransferase